jgi:spore maturation protein CgeB
MRLALFSHSLLSDWNHGSSHFLRGVATELTLGGHELRAFEPSDAWSVHGLVTEQGTWPLAAMRRAYPQLSPRPFDLATFDFDRALDGIDVVVVNEQSDVRLVKKLGAMRLSGAPFRLLFHDTGRREAADLERDLAGYDGVLAAGRALADLYVDRSWIERVWVWHEAVDARLFRPPPERAERERARTLVFVGNWGDEAYTQRMREFVIEPASELGIGSTFYGARYPDHARKALADSGARYEGWLPNFRVPDAFARHRMTFHVPRRAGADSLPGAPGVGIFEALACGIPLVSAPWDDCEGLLRSGRDYLPAWSGAAVKRQLALLVSDARFARDLAAQGRRTVLARHTCAHRANELMGILAELGVVDRLAPSIGA